MKKKWIALALTVCLLLTATACQSPEPEIKDPVTFCYRRTDNTGNKLMSIIATEQRDAQGHVGDIDWLLKTYFEGPESPLLQNPFPKGTRVLNWYISNNTLQLILSESFAQLTGIRLTVACSCIAVTFLELAGVESVEIRCRDIPLDTQESIKLDWNRLHLSDYDSNLKQESLVVYYPDGENRYLLEQTYTVNTASLDNLYAYLFKRLQVPMGQSPSPISADTELLGVSVRDGVCSLDLSNAFLESCPEDAIAQRNVLLSITNSFTQLTDVDRVEFYCDGQLLRRYGSISLETPWEYAEEAIGPVMAGLNEADVTLYLCNGSGNLLAGVPVRMKQVMDLNLQEQLLQTLAQYTTKNDFRNPIGVNAQVLSVTVTEDICYVTLSQEFLQGDIVASLRCMTATVCGNSDVKGVIFAVEGAVPAGYEPLFNNILMPVSTWYVQ